MAWHVDANNSALHMAVPEDGTLGTLHVGAKQQGDGYLWCVCILYNYIYMQISQKAVSFRSGELMMLILHVIYDHRQVGFKAHGWISQTLE